MWTDHQFETQNQNPVQMKYFTDFAKVLLFLTVTVLSNNCQNSSGSDPLAQQEAIGNTARGPSADAVPESSEPAPPGEADRSTDPGDNRNDRSTTSERSPTRSRPPAAERVPVTNREPNPETTADANGDALLTRLLELTEADREDMLAGKAEAEASGARDLAPGTFAEAMANEAIGDRLLETGKENDLLDAQQAFRQARAEYEEAQRLADAKQLAGIQREAEDSRKAMFRAKENVRGKQSDLDRLTSFREALQMEKLAESQYVAENYEEAQYSFNQATDFFNKSRLELRDLPSKGSKQGNTDASQNPPQQKKQRATPVQDQEQQRQRLAERQIKILQGRYKEGLETLDAKTLVQNGYLNRNEQKDWNSFFNDIESLSVRIEKNDFNVGRRSATVKFQVRMSYIYKNSKERMESSFGRRWTLSDNGGNWVLREVAEK